MEGLRVGIIGTGPSTGIAAAHLDGYRMAEGIRVTALFDQNLVVAEKFQVEKNCEDTILCNSFDEFLDYVDAVSICTPNFTHADYIQKLLKAGKHVICEKPIGVPGDDLDQLIDLCKNTDRIHMVDFNYRNIPALKLLHKLISDGTLGDIIIYRHTMGGGRLANEMVPLEWRMKRAASGSGSLGDFGSHMLDTIDFLIGDCSGELKNINSIQKICIPMREGKDGMQAVENDDCCIFQGVTEKRTLVSAMTSRVGTLGNQLEIIGTKGIARFQMSMPLQIELQTREEGQGFVNSPVVLQAECDTNKELWMSTKNPELLACSENMVKFVKHIIEKTPGDTSILQGIKIQKLIDQIDLTSVSY